MRLPISPIAAPFPSCDPPCAGLEVDQVREIKQVVEEDARLKRRVAELSFNKVVLQDVLSILFPFYNRIYRLLPDCPWLK